MPDGVKPFSLVVIKTSHGLRDIISVRDAAEVGNIVRTVETQEG